MAIIGYADTAVFQAAIKKLAADNNMDMPAEDVVISTRHLTDAYNHIIGVLVTRGLTKAAADTWSRGAEFQYAIALYWYGRQCGWGGRHDEDKDWIKPFDRRKELENIAVLDVTGGILLEGKSAFAVGMDLISINESLGFYS
ncbi:MAG: hypothetical protein FVQ80_11460 [Planctomycetes bacterium]|nr:hypothetical protein [Planctomycetota bacterium]